MYQTQIFLKEALEKLFLNVKKNESGIEAADHSKILALQNDPRSEPRLSLLRTFLTNAIHEVKTNPNPNLDNFTAQIALKMQTHVIRCEEDFQLSKGDNKHFKAAIKIALSYLHKKAAGQDFWVELPAPAEKDFPVASSA